MNTLQLRVCSSNCAHTRLYKSYIDSCRQEQPEDLPTEKTPTPKYEQQWAPPKYEQQWAPNTIQIVIMICNAKGIKDQEI